MNVTVRDGVVRRRSGYTRLGDILVDNTFAITAAVVASDYFVVAGDQSANFTIGQKIRVEGSTANDGVWTVSDITVPGSTRIWVEEDITDNTVDGWILTGDPVLGLTEFSAIGGTDVLVALTGKGQFYYDVSNNVWVDISQEETASYAIDAVVVATKRFQHTAADLSAQLPAGTKFSVVGSTGNDRTYTVNSIVAAGPPFIIDVTEAIDVADADGNIVVVKRYPITTSDATDNHFTVLGISLGIAAGDIIFAKDTSGNGDDGTWFVESILEVTGTHTEITVTGDITSDVVSGYLTRRKDFTYTEGTLIDSHPVTGTVQGKRLIVLNGVDNPVQWFGGTSTPPNHFVRWAPRLESFVTAGSIGVFKEFLFIGNVETSSSDPQFIAWSDTGDFDDFINGNAGGQLLYDLTSGIEGMEMLGDRLVIYSDDAIVNAVFVGLPYVFGFETVIPVGTRLTSSRSVTSINVGHIYAAQENFYIFDGTRGLRTISDIIQSDYRGSKDNDNLHKVATLNDPAKRTIYAAIPDLDGGAIVYTLEYNAFDLAQRAWSKIKYADAPRSFGFYTNPGSLPTWADEDWESDLAATYGDTYLNWEYEFGSWHNEGEQPDFPVRVFGDAFGCVYIDSESVLDDNGASQDGHYETIDFTVPESFLSQYGRWGEIEFEARGDSVDVLTSKDYGGSPDLVETISLGPMSVQRIPIDIHSRTLRVRFEFTGDFELRWVKLWVKPAASR
jgi:hypothetical protein